MKKTNSRCRKMSIVVEKILLTILAMLLSVGICVSEEIPSGRHKKVEDVVEKWKNAVISQSKSRIKESENEIQNMGRDAGPQIRMYIADRSQKPEIRQGAMDAVVAIGDETAAESLIRVAEDSTDEWYHRVAAMQHVRRLSDKLAKSDAGIDKKYMQNLKRLFDDEKNKINIRNEALVAYGVIGQNDSLPVLNGKLDDKNEAVIANAIYGIGAVRTPEGEDALLKVYLRKKGTPAEGLCVRLLGIHKVKKSVPFLIDTLENIKVKKEKSMQDEVMRGTYIKALGEIGEKASMPVLKKLIDNTGKDFDGILTAVDAAEALAKMGDYEYLKKVIQKVEIDARVGKGNEKRLRNMLKRMTGIDYDY